MNWVSRSLVLGVGLCALPNASAAVTGHINEDGRLVVVGEGEQVGGLDFLSKGGYFTPIPPGDLSASADPFQFVLSNSPTQVTLANVGFMLTLDGELELPVGYVPPDGIDPATDIFAQCTAGYFDVDIPFVGVAEPSSMLLATLGLGPFVYRLRRRGRHATIAQQCI